MIPMQINSQTATLEIKYQNLKHKRANESDHSSEALQSEWTFVNEPIGISKRDAFAKPRLLEQINTTADVSDYLWYSIR